MSTKAGFYLLFGSKTRADLLAFLLLHPEEAFYIRQLAQCLDQSPTPVIRELRKLAKLGLVKSEAKAKAIYFTINQASPFFFELQNIALKTIGVGEVLKNNLKSLAPIQYAFIYGSFASHEAGPQSDLDLFLIGRVSLRDLTQAIKKTEMRIKREIQHSIFTKEEFLKELKKGNDFLNQVVVSPKIMLIGAENDFKRFSQTGLD